MAKSTPPYIMHTDWRGNDLYVILMEKNKFIKFFASSSCFHEGEGKKLLRFMKGESYFKFLFIVLEKDTAGRTRKNRKDIFSHRQFFPPLFVVCLNWERRQRERGWSSRKKDSCQYDNNFLIELSLILECGMFQGY